MKGTHIGDMTTKEGKKMTDTYLRKRLSKDYPWINDVYKHTSGYVHLSNKHMLDTFKMSGDGEFSILIHEQSSYVPESAFIDATEALKESTKLLLGLIRGWVVQRNCPEDGEEIQRKQD